MNEAGFPTQLEAMTASDALVSGEDEGQLRAEGAGLRLHAVQLAGCEPHWMAEAARATGGKVITLDLKAEKQAYARTMLEKSGLLDYVEFRCGDALNLIAQMTETEVLGRRVEELTARLDEQGRFLADREFASDRLRTEATNAQRVEAEIRAALARAAAEKSKGASP